VRDVGRAFTKPDDDWAPMALLGLPGGQIIPAAVDMSFFADDAAKDALVDTALPALIAETGANKLALVLSAWMRVVSIHAPMDARGYPADGIRPTDAPDRQEVVAVGVYDAERVEAHLARIIRDGKRPPRLARWIAQPTTDLAGRFFGQRIQEAMR
jgi:hypothetical protein